MILASRAFSVVCLLGMLAAPPIVAQGLPAPETAQTVAAEASDAPATRTPVLLAPVDRWREDPKVMLESVEIDLDDFMWIARPVVVFAETAADPAFQRQIELLAGRADDLVRRDVVVITDTDPAAMSSLRRKLRPRGFMLVLIGKDGEVELRKPFPWDVRELSRSIDKMPLRKQELREQQNANQ
ncbi:hypothetical protein OCGS_0524 [Oceaniovalibus guishaninsula JLT2003]|uniref:DUF4174 domain-containing protein n=1 Tax=Oceaniovalibus guishaninsula JLT2003 TaxID=1231392 RepID=K2HRS4_9RHOB|nr:DUF4174 domain-containing protein [Oceaniovalibus guishaninsula]EKE45434.1 hypothetical protein OCGS_0524 [Oceaniovalibus guishaninsula JLT2003]